MYLRGPGLLELERETLRSKRTGLPLALGFVDIDYLKSVNDAHGHAAGDQLLLSVANTMKAKLRPYDLIIRLGGDEFACGLSGLDMAGAAARMALVSAALAQAPEHGSVTIGLAELRADDSIASLIGRADAALYRERQKARQRP